MNQFRLAARLDRATPRPRSILPATAVLVCALMVTGTTATAKMAAPAVDDLASRAANKGRLRVLIELRSAGIDRSAQSAEPAAVESRARQVARVVEALEAEQILPTERILARFEAIPYVAAALTAAEIRRLAGDDRVLDIGEAGTASTNLLSSRARIGADAAHLDGVDGSAWSVAVLDTGIDASHPAFFNRVVFEGCIAKEDVHGDGSEFVDSCTNGTVVSRKGEGPGWASPTKTLVYRQDRTTFTSLDDHGTHVSGIAMSRGFPEIYRGIAPGANLVAFNVFGNSYHDVVDEYVNPKRGSDADTEDVLLALDRIYQLRDAIRISAVNISLGSGLYNSDCVSGNGENAAYNAMFAALRGVGIAPVAAAGNLGAFGLGRPACVPNAISVGSSTNDDIRSTFSNYLSSMTFFAPGNGIFAPTIGGGIGEKFGTSMAAPHVAGAITALQQLCTGPRSKETLDEILDVLRQTGKPIALPNLAASVPRINLGAAANLLIQRHIEPRRASLEPFFGGGTSVRPAVGSIESTGRFVALDAGDGAVVVGHSRSGRYGPSILRFSAWGSLDFEFGLGGGAGGFELPDANGFVTDAAFQPDGKMVVAGWVARNHDWWFVARFTSAGQLDPTFGDGSERPGVTVLQLGTVGGRPSAVAIQPDGGIVLGGITNSGPNYLTFARVDSAGRIDRNFGAGGTAVYFPGATAGISGLEIARDGKIVAGGFFTAGPDYFMVLRLLPGGALDEMFGGVNAVKGVTLTPIGTLGARANEIAIQGDGKVLLVGTSNSGPDYLTLARYTVDGILDSSFGRSNSGVTDVGLLGVGTKGYGVAVQGDGKILVVGERVNECRTTEGLVARFTNDGQLDTRFQKGGSGTVIASSFLNGIAVGRGRTIVSGTGFRSGRTDILVAELPRERQALELAVDFGTSFGLWTVDYIGLWRRLNVLSPGGMVRADMNGVGVDELIADFGSAFGVWAWRNNSSWEQLNGRTAELMTSADMDGNGKDEVVFDFGATYGVWVRRNDSSWEHLHGRSPELMASADIDGNGKDEVLLDFGSVYGVWLRRNDSSWEQLHVRSPELMTSADLDSNGKDEVLLDFGSANGVWLRRNDMSWEKLHGASPELMIRADMDGSGKDEVVFDFGAAGVWAWRNDASWQHLHSISPQDMTSGDVNKTGRDEVVLDFGSTYGVWLLRDESAWQQIHPLSPESIVATQLDIN